MAEKYVIRVTAGPDYDIDNHTVVPVNAPETVKVSTELGDVELNVRIQDYSGLPRKSPASSPYFDLEPHKTANDRYSIAIRFTPKAPKGSAAAKDTTGGGDDEGDDDDDDEDTPQGISGGDLQFGNDFDHPIRDKLPPGFSYAMNIVKWWIDPGLDGDAYADEPYLYGPGISSFNALYVGKGEHDPARGGLVITEGGDEAGLEARRDLGAPETAKERMKWGLKQDSKDRWVYEYGQTYCFDFFNPYLDFNDFALRLPGFTLPIMKYWDGQPLSGKPPKRSHTLRYVLRNRSSGDTYLVILFTLYLKEDVEEDGTLKAAALAA
ncbi:hypothetical protein Micbo1qcDRAFT_107946, partial [Microdochium bolleyi]